MPFVLVASLFSGGAWAATPPSTSIPESPSAPPVLNQPKRQETFTCERKFQWKGQLYDCDSELYWDGENLRPIFQDVPEALKLLDQYQETRRDVQVLAYTGTAGLVLIVAGYFIGRGVGGGRGTAIRNAMMGSGLVLGAGGVFLGLGLLKSNEAQLGRAVKVYNQAKPDTPVELQFETGFKF